jgi:hypothetical protein
MAADRIRFMMFLIGGGAEVNRAILIGRNNRYNFISQFQTCSISQLLSTTKKMVIEAFSSVLYLLVDEPFH